MPTRRILVVSALGALLAVESFNFLVKLWASRQAAEGEHSAVAGAILGGM